MGTKPEQNILYASPDYIELDEYFTNNKIHRVLLVCDSAIRYLKLNEYFTPTLKRNDTEIIRFHDFQPNPTYESVVAGVELFRQKNCDAIVAIGGGSAMDVAKCIKVYSNMSPYKSYLEQAIVPNDIMLMAIPTTAGTGSEATRYAVIYYLGEKQSVTDDSCIPQTVLFDASVLATLPLYQKKATMLDALCHAIESYWSVNSTETSILDSREAIRRILGHMDGYLGNTEEGNRGMLEAANLAGKAINITQTTGGHAMCYKITSLFGTAHGHAVALCLPPIWEYIATHTEKCNDKRGIPYLKEILAKIAETMGCSTTQQSIDKFKNLVERLKLAPPKCDAAQLDILVNSVNPARLKNSPVLLDKNAIEMIYQKIFEGDHVCK